MRRIEKRPQEPHELLEYRKSGGTKYEGFPYKDGLRQPLVEDQGALCCYCMRRICAGDMKVEHYRSQSRHPEQQLEWSYLLGACKGGEGGPPRDQTCDTRKADADITIDPMTTSVERLRYPPDGRIICDDTVVQQDLDDRLNLNHEELKRGRRAALTGFKEGLVRRLGSERKWQRRTLEHEIHSLRGDKPFKEYVALLEYWLRKQVERR
ncbi:MAG: retron system putative HNH endonuclease [Acidobacteriota bacterium]